MLLVSLFFVSSVPKYIKQNKPLFKKAVSLALNNVENSNIEINLIFTNSQEIKKINKRFLNKNSVTDVIAFNYHPEKNFKHLPGTKPFGDIYICIDRARKQAKSYKHSLLKELLILTAHGALHLMGMEDKTRAQKRKMQSQTHKIISELFSQ